MADDDLLDTLWNLTQPPMPSMPSLTKSCLPTETAKHLLTDRGKYERHPLLSLRSLLPHLLASWLHRDTVRSNFESRSLDTVLLVFYLDKFRTCGEHSLDLTLTSLMTIDVKAMMCFDCTVFPALNTTSAFEKSSPTGRVLIGFRWLGDLNVLIRAFLRRVRAENR